MVSWSVISVNICALHILIPVSLCPQINPLLKVMVCLIMHVRFDSAMVMGKVALLLRRIEQCLEHHMFSSFTFEKSHIVIVIVIVITCSIVLASAVIIIILNKCMSVL